MTARTLLADLPACPDARPVPLSAALRKYAKWRKAGIRLFLDGTESRAIAWAAESRCPGLLVQVCGEAAKDRHLTLLHAPSGLLLGKAALRWPATTAGLEAALVASQGAADLLPAGAWVADDPAAQAGDRAVFVARGRAWAREVGNPSTWYVGASAPLRGWPDEVRRTAEDTARTSGAPVEVRGYADATDRSAGVPMVRYRLEWLDRQPIVTDYRSATAQAADVERLARFYAAGEPGSRADLARLVLGGADIPGAAQGAPHRVRSSPSGGGPAADRPRAGCCGRRAMCSPRPTAPSSARMRARCSAASRRGVGSWAASGSPRSWTCSAPCARTRPPRHARACPSRPSAYTSRPLCQHLRRARSRSSRPTGRLGTAPIARGPALCDGSDRGGGRRSRSCPGPGAATARSTGRRTGRASSRRTCRRRSPPRSARQTPRRDVPHAACQR